MLALRRIVAGRGHVANYWESARVRIRVGHLYPDYLNIYADRGNIAVLAARAALRGHELDVRADRAARRGPGRRSTCSTSAAARIASRSSSRRPRRQEPMRCTRPSRAARRSSPSAAATSCSAAPTATSPAPSCPGSACSARDRRRLAAHDRRRAARLRLGRARRSPGSRTMPAGRCSTTAPSRSAA